MTQITMLKELTDRLDAWEMNRQTDAIAHLHWLEGTQLGPKGLEYIDTPWACGFEDGQEVAING